VPFRLSENVIRSISKSLTPYPYIPASFFNKDDPKLAGNVLIDDCKGIEAAIDNTGAPSESAATIVSAIIAGDKVEDGDAAEDDDAVEDGNKGKDDDGACFGDDTICKDVKCPQRRPLELTCNKYISRIFELNQAVSSSRILQSP
jgi:hypothetical protein